MTERKLTTTAMKNDRLLLAIIHVAAFTLNIVIIELLAMLPVSKKRYMLHDRNHQISKMMLFVVMMTTMPI
jgi:hypothetical protein